MISEALLIDWQHEGGFEAFDVRLVDEFPIDDERLVCFGGVSSARLGEQLLAIPEVAAIAVGNTLSYREHAIQEFKAGLVLGGARAPVYSNANGMVRNG